MDVFLTVCYGPTPDTRVMSGDQEVAAFVRLEVGPVGVFVEELVQEFSAVLGIIVD
jgi:hypothetical protein